MARTAKGRTLMTSMVVGDYCFIQIEEDGSIDILRGPTPRDFSGQYRGIVTEVDYSTNGPPWPIRAIFADPRITKASDTQIARLDGREPPFRYQTLPRYRMQGLTGFRSFELHDQCIIQIPDWREHPELLENPGMTPEEIERAFPVEMIGLWEARIIYASTSGHEMDDGQLYRVAATLADPNLAASENEAIRRWNLREPPVGYHVFPPDMVATTVLQVTRGWNSLRKKLAQTRKRVREEGNAFFENITG